MNKILYSRPHCVKFDYYPGALRFRLPIFNHNIPFILDTTPFMNGDYILSARLIADPMDYYFLDDNKPVKISEIIPRLK